MFAMNACYARRGNRTVAAR